VPGMIVSQHSGEGKANQYFLRGFNLDHGTDFATTVAGVPVNTPTGAHAQGWMDLNFLIPELVSGVQFKKVGSGLIPRFGLIDATDEGKASRQTVAVEFRGFASRGGFLDSAGSSGVARRRLAVLMRAISKKRPAA